MGTTNNNFWLTFSRCGFPIPWDYRHVNTSIFQWIIIWLPIRVKEIRNWVTMNQDFWAKGIQAIIWIRTEFYWRTFTSSSPKEDDRFFRRCVTLQHANIYSRDINILRCGWCVSEQGHQTIWLQFTSTYHQQAALFSAEPRLSIKTVFPRYGITNLKIIRTRDRLIFKLESLFW